MRGPGQQRLPEEQKSHEDTHAARRRDIGFDVALIVINMPLI